jgi:Ca2+-binding EF-hand superfamily protein
LHLDILFNEIDRDKSGNIDFSEFCAIFERFMNEGHVREVTARAIFDFLDRDQRGVISLRNLHDFLGDEDQRIVKRATKILHALRLKVEKYNFTQENCL